MTKGFAGPYDKRKKYASTMSSTAIAQPTSGSLSRLRIHHMAAATYPAKTNTHIRIEPSRALHTAAKLYKAGVADDPTFCTYSSEKSRVIIAHSMTANAASAMNDASATKRGTRRNVRGSLRRAPMAAANAPKNAARNPASSIALPRWAVALAMSMRHSRTPQFGRHSLLRIRWNASPRSEWPSRCR